jgi:phosphatidylinositol alpha-1,6-mannosyltransferase
VAAVSRLVWQVFQDRWPNQCRLVTLVQDSSASRSLESTTAHRVRFGARLATGQLLGQCPWILYSHASVAHVQAFVPAVFRRPYAVFLHGIEAWRPLSLPQRRILEGASLLVANSRYTARRVARAHEWVGRIAECPLALPPAAPAGRDPSSGAVGADMGPQAVLVVARMLSTERYKGHDQLLEAWPAVIRRVPAARLVLVGDGDDKPRLQAKAAELGVGRAVVFTGFVSADALATIYRHAAVFAMPSRDEGFGLVYLEAMAHQLPCVGSIHDAAGDIIDDGRTGYLVDQADDAGLVDRLASLLTDEARRREMGARGYRRLASAFTYEQFRDRLLSLLTTRLGAHRAALVSTLSAD